MAASWESQVMGLMSASTVGWDAWVMILKIISVPQWVCYNAVFVIAYYNLASDEVILELVRAKCTQILFYGLKCSQLGRADLHSLDFTFNRLCIKLFKNGSVDVVKDCLNRFAIDLLSCVLKKSG